MVTIFILVGSLRKSVFFHTKQKIENACYIWKHANEVRKKWQGDSWLGGSTRDYTSLIFWNIGFNEAVILNASFYLSILF